MSDYKRMLVTSALPYANGPIHLGHLAGAYLPADIFVRYQKLKKQDVVFICGSDEHGVPITLLAEKRGVTPQDIVDEFHERNKKSFFDFGIRFDNFSRTSQPEHKKLSQEFFLKLKENEYLTPKTSQQFFSPKGQRFLPDRYVEGTCPFCGADGARGDQCDSCGKWIDQTKLINPISKIDGDTPELRETTHWFLKLGDFQEKIIEWLDTKDNWKNNVLNFCKGWFAEGLRDRSVTRDLSWGIPVPVEGYEDKVLYVWFDAPIGYISATKEWAEQVGAPDKWKEYWQNKDTRLIHFIGKDNIVFHAIVWPAILMGYDGDWVMPAEIPANEFLNLEGEKLSTSKNYAVWLEDYLKSFQPDPLRYSLAANAPESKDADFSWKEFQARNNGELADVLGNFINRSLTFMFKNYDKQVPEQGELDDMDRDMLKKITETRDEVGACLEKFEVRKGVATYINLARAANKYFNDKEPWKVFKEDKEACGTTMNVCVQVCRALSVLGAPFLPFMAKKLWKMLKLDGNIHAQSWDEVGLVEVEAGHKVGKIKILFPKIEDEQIQPEVDRLQTIASGANPDIPADLKPTISYDDFDKIDLRVATVLDVEPIPKTKKLMKLQLDLGFEKRTIVAGLAEKFTPEELKGRQIIIVANLEPATLRGVESNGMLLAAEDHEGNMQTLSVYESVGDGAKIR